ncbi:MAG: phosphotransferase family protein [Shimia sp.]|uniref:phosphotransferase family protein n=1 Tax=Shimia sp. TaxID=1954381 RepID=UPI0040592A38
MSDLHDRCVTLIAELGIAAPSDVTRVQALTGGVASDIARVDVGTDSYAIKFALSKLKVAADWRAPLHRNAAEYAWLQTAARVCPDAAVRLFGQSTSDHGFVMEFLNGPDVYLWKDSLLAQAAPKAEAARVGDMLGRIHAASTAADFDTGTFQNRDDFRALRIEPYLTFTADKNPELSDALHGLADMLYEAKTVLVHGDVSPKNILFRDSGPVLLDAECATMGDASFDPAFCLNHLVLKAIHLPASFEALIGEVHAFWASYLRHITWEDASALEARICRLLPPLMLACVDGKSPVEYLSETDQAVVRTIAITLISQPSATLATLTDRLTQQLKEQTA